MSRFRAPRPSTHFSWNELACRDPNNPAPYPTKWRAGRCVRLMGVAEGFRHINGDRPLGVGSGYRTPSWNRKKGGASSSQHPQGKGIDLHRPKGQRLVMMHRNAVEFAMSDPYVGGLGLYLYGVHFDVRPRKARAVAFNHDLAADYAVRRFAFWDLTSRYQPNVPQLHDLPGVATP